jgi:serine/threonine protein kinase
MIRMSIKIWAIGVIMYTLLVGVPPFETAKVESTYKRIRANLYSFPQEANVSDYAQNLIRQILHPTPGLISFYIIDDDDYDLT